MAITKVPEWKLASKDWKFAGFDWNSTVLNDFWLWIEWQKYIYTYYGLSIPYHGSSRDEISTDFMGHYWKNGITVPKKELNERRAEFMRPYLKKLSLQDGSIALLEECKRRGMKIVIVSAEKNSIFRGHMRHFHLKEIADRTKGGVSRKKDFLVKYLKEFEIKPEDAFYIGDTASDVRDAKDVGMSSVAFTGGLNTEKKLLEANPDFICHSFVEALK